MAKSITTGTMLALVLWVGCGGAADLVAQVNSAKDTSTRPTWTMVDVDTQANLRGLHVYDTKHIFASGSGGTVLQSRDGGDTWQVRIVDGAESLDFRDIHAIDPNNLVIMSSGTPARMYRSVDGGKSWTQTFERIDEKYFLDAIAFWDDKNGLVMGDAVDGRVLLLQTTDGGHSWQELKNSPLLKPGEAGFAASGTNMTTVGKNKVVIALGGAPAGDAPKASRVLLSDDRGKNWRVAEVPMARSPSAGIFSLTFIDRQHGIALGGDYKNENNTAGVIAVTNDGGETWSVPGGPEPGGFRSCAGVMPYSVTIVGDEANPTKGKAIFCVGPNGTDISLDNGLSWSQVSKEGFHAIDFAPGTAFGWACGSEGRVARMW